MSDTGGLAGTVVRVLTSEAARKIDFRLNLIKVDAADLPATAMAVTTGIIRLEVVPAGEGGAEYKEKRNTLVFRSARFGSRSHERSTIIHECVHAMHDVFSGYYVPTFAGSQFMTQSENEAAAYIAGALYLLNEDGSTKSGSTIFDYATTIARRIKGTTNAIVTTEESMELRSAIADSRLYRMTTKTRTLADGL